MTNSSNVTQNLAAKLYVPGVSCDFYILMSEQTSVPTISTSVRIEKYLSFSVFSFQSVIFDDKFSHVMSDRIVSK